jgi:hypothetical protein
LGMLVSQLPLRYLVKSWGEKLPRKNNANE